MTDSNEKFSNLQSNLEKFKSVENLDQLKTVKINLKDFNVTNEDEHITISFNEEDLAEIKNGGANFIAVTGRRC